jgi:uncharacterized RDD family membrane protein YckC
MDRLETPERVDLTVDLAGVGSRTLAFLIDWFLLLAVTIVSVLIFASISPVTGTLAVVLVMVCLFVLWWFYFVLFEMAWDGQTPGKRLLGLRVRKVGGYPIGWPEALIRNFLRVLIDLFLFWIPIGLPVMIGTRRSQRIGDLAAGTVVVREGRPGMDQLAELGVTGETKTFSAGGLDLTTEEYELIREFLGRSAAIDSASAGRIRAELADLVRKRLEARNGMRDEWREIGDEAFLLQVDAFYRGAD